MSAVKRYRKENIGILWKKLKEALPVICFFLILFYSMLLFFGISYLMTVSIATVIFKGNYRKQHSAESLLKLILLHLFLAVLAYLATLNYPFCLLLNLLVPFWLIFKKSSQFDPMGYFSGLMTFTLLQLAPKDLRGFGMQLAAFSYALFCFFAVMYVYQRRKKPLPEYQVEQMGLLLFSGWISQELEGGERKTGAGQFFSLQQELYQKAYHKSFWGHGRTLPERVHYSFALMYQRAAYFVDSGYQPGMFEEQEVQIFCGKMAAYLKSAGEHGFLEMEQRHRLQEEGGELLGEIERRDEELFLFFENFLRPFLAVLKRLEEAGEGGSEKQIPQRAPRYGKVWSKKKWKTAHISPRMLWTDSFELKFALRMSVVLAVTFSYSMLSHADHGFWLPMNAFLLLRPMYEESIHRMKSRFVGTAAGCILLVMILPLLPGTKGHILFASIIVIGLYTAAPGTWQQALFSTCFALSITTLAIAEKTALELRLFYVVIAILVVLVVNRFVFPMSLKSQFVYNFQSVFHIHHSYLRILEQALRGVSESDMICNAQLAYHLVHEQSIRYLEKQEPNPSHDYRKLLSISWKMISEMEQMFVLVNTRKWEEAELIIWKDYIMYTDYVLNQVQQMLDMKPEKSIGPVKEVPYQRWMEHEPQLSLLMTRYSKNLSRLYQMVCQMTDKRKYCSQMEP